MAVCNCLFPEGCILVRYRPLFPLDKFGCKYCCERSIQRCTIHRCLIFLARKSCSSVYSSNSLQDQELDHCIARLSKLIEPIHIGYHKYREDFSFCISRLEEKCNESNQDCKKCKLSCSRLSIHNGKTSSCWMLDPIPS